MYKRKKVTETDFPEFKLQNSLSNSVTLKNQSVSKVFAMARFTKERKHQRLLLKFGETMHTQPSISPFSSHWFIVIKVKNY